MISVRHRHANCNCVSGQWKCPIHMLTLFHFHPLSCTKPSIASASLQRGPLPAQLASNEARCPIATSRWKSNSLRPSARSIRLQRGPFPRHRLPLTQVAHNESRCSPLPPAHSFRLQWMIRCPCAGISPCWILCSMLEVGHRRLLPVLGTLRRNLT